MTPAPLRADDLHFDLPPDLVAQRPADERDAARLLAYDRAAAVTRHLRVRDLPSLVRDGDVLVFNDARVTPARFDLTKPTGGRVSGLFLKEESPGAWLALLRAPGRNFAEPWAFTGTRTPVRVAANLGGGRYRLEVDDARPAEDVLADVGTMPLPPYVARPADADDVDRYQTVYASTPGSVAAPTAGLHFTPELLAALDARGVIRATLTLHVGVGTFRPVTAATLDAHPMHTERYVLPAACCDAVNAARRDARRVVAVGTTTCRVLESQPAGDVAPHTGVTDLLITPGRPFRHTSALWTNFHLPRSTLIALVAAFTGLDVQRLLYAQAVRERYRFFSYGDAMFVT